MEMEKSWGGTAMVNGYLFWLGLRTELIFSKAEHSGAKKKDGTPFIFLVQL